MWYGYRLCCSQLVLIFSIFISVCHSKFKTKSDLLKHRSLHFREDKPLPATEGRSAETGENKCQFCGKIFEVNTNHNLRKGNSGCLRTYRMPICNAPPNRKREQKHWPIIRDVGNSMYTCALYDTLKLVSIITPKQLVIYCMKVCLMQWITVTIRHIAAWTWFVYITLMDRYVIL